MVKYAKLVAIGALLLVIASFGGVPKWLKGTVC